MNSLGVEYFSDMARAPKMINQEGISVAFLPVEVWVYILPSGVIWEAEMCSQARAPFIKAWALHSIYLLSKVE